MLDLQNNYDTQQLLAVVDGLDRLIDGWKREDGLRDAVLRLHGMANTVINAARLATPAGRETLPELASDITGELLAAGGLLRSMAKLIEPLEGLRARD